MDDNTKEEALVCIKDEFNLQSRELVRNDWIIGGSIPEAYQERIVEMLQCLLRKQRQAIKEYWYFFSFTFNTFQHIEESARTIILYLIMFYSQQIKTYNGPGA